VAALLLVSGQAVAQPITCTIDQKYSCAPSGCEAAGISVHNVLDLDRRTIARCDQKGCDEYPMNASRSGIFIVIDVPGRGMLAKLSADGNSSVEVVTLGTSAVVSFGTCR
jgi:hypothetical protein